MTTARVVVFVDYQNVYRRARACFGLEADSHPAGQIRPLELGLRIAGKRQGRELDQVRIYRGLPDSTKDPQGNAPARRQIQSWEPDPRTHVFTRTLRYPGDWPVSKAQEKGVDVALAVDFVTMAVRGEFDVGVIFSNDTDLLPALESVLAMTQGAGLAEVAAWQPDAGHGYRLRIPGESLWCNWLTKQDYEVVADSRDYNIVTRASGG